MVLVMNNGAGQATPMKYFHSESERILGVPSP
jgi:hypothetical protein